jgi:hypothetical protein
VTNGPLPPHERSWRHPSELPGTPPEPATRGGRLLIVAVGTVGLVLVGVLALTMTPQRADRAGQAVATTTLALLAPSVMSAEVATAPPATVGATVLATTSVLLALGVPTTEPRASVVATLRPGGEGSYGASSTFAATAAAPVISATPVTATGPAATAAPTTAPATTAAATTAAPVTTGAPTTSGYASASAADTASTARMLADAPPVGAFGSAIDTVADRAPDTVPATVVDTSAATDDADTDDADTGEPTGVAPAFPLVTPVGPDGLAITTHAACTSCTRGSMTVTLPSGSVVGVQVIDAEGRFVVVSLPADAGYSAISVADASRAPSSMSVMYDGVYTPIDTDSAGALCTPEAAPVLDDHGQLLGLCTASGDGASIVPVDSLPPVPVVSTPATDAATATTTTAAAAPTTIAPSTTPPPTTVAPSMVPAG